MILKKNKMLLPKEKAQELYDKYYIVCQEFTEKIQCSIQAKQCALISVYEIIDALEKYDDVNDTYELQNMDSDFRYWDKVKHELNKSEKGCACYGSNSIHECNCN